MNRYLMAIDAGTGSIRAIIFNEQGEEVATSQREWEHICEDGVPNSMQFDFENNWKLAQICIKDALQKSNISANDIVAISATSMREGIVLYDKSGKELWAVANVDARADKEVQILKEKYNGIEEEFYKISGQTFALGALPRLLWLKNNRPKTYEKVDKISMIGDWILFKLSGELVSEPSNAGTTGIFSLLDRDWSPFMASKLELKDNIFPKIAETGTTIGTVSKEASKLTGLSTKTKIVTGGGDVQLGALALGLVGFGDAAILGGSFWQQVVNIPHSTTPPSDMSIRVNPHVIPKQSQAEGITFFSGLIMRWFRDAFCDAEKTEALKRKIDVYTLLEERSKNIPAGSHGVIPIFSDSMKYGKWYHASPSFLNLTIDSKICNKYTIFKSLQENAAIVSSINLDRVTRFSDLDIKEIVFAGGASKGEEWSQIVSDATNKVVKVPKIKEATALGAAIAAGVGTGVFEKLSNAKELIIWEREYHPNSKNNKIYNELKEKWQKIYEEQLKLTDLGLTTSMWRAPGV